MYLKTIIYKIKYMKLDYTFSDEKKRKFKDFNKNLTTEFKMSSSSASSGFFELKGKHNARIFQVNGMKQHIWDPSTCT